MVYSNPYSNADEKQRKSRECSEQQRQERSQQRTRENKPEQCLKNPVCATIHPHAYVSSRLQTGLRRFTTGHNFRNVAIDVHTTKMQLLKLTRESVNLFVERRAGDHKLSSTNCLWKETYVAAPSRLRSQITTLRTGSQHEAFSAS
jgi:hypothetical protein